MKNIKHIFLIGLLITSQSLHSQTNFVQNEHSEIDTFLLFFRSNEMHYENAKKEFGLFCEELKSKKGHYKNEVNYLRYIFDKINQVYLTDYDEYVSLNEVFLSKRYNCVSGTALFALVLQKLGYRFNIRETTFHSFLLVQTSDSQIMLWESTDKEKGFITDFQSIQDKIESYKQAESKKSEHYLAFFHKETNLVELAGLQIFNEAVVVFNEKNYQKADELLTQALLLYDCERIRSLKKYSTYFSVGQNYK